MCWTARLVDRFWLWISTRNMKTMTSLLLSLQLYNFHEYAYTAKGIKHYQLKKLVQTTCMLESLSHFVFTARLRYSGQKRQRNADNKGKTNGWIDRTLDIRFPKRSTTTEFLCGLPKHLQAARNYRLVRISDKLQSFQFKSFNSVLFL